MLNFPPLCAFFVVQPGQNFPLFSFAAPHAPQTSMVLLPEEARSVHPIPGSGLKCNYFDCLRLSAVTARYSQRRQQTHKHTRRQKGSKDAIEPYVHVCVSVCVCLASFGVGINVSTRPSDEVGMFRDENGSKRWSDTDSAKGREGKEARENSCK